MNVVVTAQTFDLSALKAVANNAAEIGLYIEQTAAPVASGADETASDFFVAQEALGTQRVNESESYGVFAPEDVIITSLVKGDYATVVTVGVEDAILSDGVTTYSHPLVDVRLRDDEENTTHYATSETFSDTFVAEVSPVTEADMTALRDSHKTAMGNAKREAMQAIALQAMAAVGGTLATVGAVRILDSNAGA